MNELKNECVLDRIKVLPLLLPHNTGLNRQWKKSKNPDIVLRVESEINFMIHHI